MGNRQKFSLYFPGIKNESNNNIALISADVREDRTTVAQFLTENGSLKLQVEANYDTKNFESISDIINDFKNNQSLQNISRIALGVPCPVIENTGYSDRLKWNFDGEEIAQKTGVEKVLLINDLEASAYGLADLSDECLTTIYEGEDVLQGNVAILSPGNGLGEAGLFYDGKYLRPFATEGGHSEFSPRTAVEVEFYQFLNKIYGIVSWENVLSKTGIFNIFRFLRDEKRHPQSENLTQRLLDGDFVSMLYKAAVEDNEQICTIAINTYLEFLAREANSLVLKLKATGGLLIGGEIPLLFREYIDKERFYQKFMISDKMESLLKHIPIYLMTSDRTILNGSAYYAAFNE